MLYKKSKKLNKSQKALRRLYLLLILVPVLGLSGYIIKLNYASALPDPQNIARGIQEPPGAYNNLDLSIATSATYPSEPVKLVKELGIIRGADHKIIRFDVKKDKLTEYGLMTLPTTPAPKGGYPVIILAHGYVHPLYYSTEQSYLGDMEYYSQNGFAVIKPDLRGQGLSIGAGSADGAYYSMAYNTDVMSLISAIKLTDTLNKDKISIWGHSMGAYIALRASVLSPDIKNTIILSGPVGSVQDMYNAYVSISDTNNPTAGAIRSAQLSAHDTPVANPQYWNKISPLSYLKNTNSFVQIHIGSSDSIVPPKFSSDLDLALSDAGKAHEYFVYQGAGHGLIGQRDTIWSRSLYRLTQN